MIEVSGTANAFSDLLTALVNACTANGFTYNSTTNVLYKGSLAVKLASTSTSFSIQLGVNVDGSGNLVSPAPYALPMMVSSNQTVTFPVNYRVFIYTNPDYVQITIKHDVVFFQHLGFGNAINLGATGDSGRTPFFWGSYRPSGGDGNTNYVNVGIDPNSGAGSFRNHSAIPFYTGGPMNTGYGINVSNAMVYVNEPTTYNGTASAIGWTGNFNSTNAVSCWTSANDTFMTIRRTPNLFNGDSAFVPIRPMMQRPSGFFSYKIQLPHMRLIRNDYYTDEQILVRGSDKWRVLPCRKKNTSQRNSQVSVDDSGTYAFAMEYTDQ